MDNLSGNAGQTVVTNKIASDFTTLAGSTENARSLVTGLRTGSAITLTAQASATSSGTAATASSVTFTPPTGTMGNGNVYISLSLAQQQLAAMGITQPTPEQIQAVLMGGTLSMTNGTTTTTQPCQGILQMRDSGMGWGQIAKSLGVKLGPVIAAMKSGNTYLAGKLTKPGANATLSGSKSGAPASSTAGGGKGNGSTYHADGHRGIVTASGAPAGRSYLGGYGGKGNGNAYGVAHGSTTAGSGVITAGGGNAAGAGGNGKALGHMN